MFIPYTNRQIRVIKYSHLHRHYNDAEIDNLTFQLNDEKDAWHSFLKHTPLTDFFVCIIQKSAVHKLKCFYDVKYEVKNAIDNATHLIVSILLLRTRVMKHTIFRFIDCVSTILSGCSFGTYIIHRVAKKLGYYLIPQTIIPVSIGYWKKYLLRIFGLTNIDDYKDFIKTHKLDNVICWNELFK
jgi:hypothetical protein